MKKFWWGMLAGVVVICLIPLIILATGMFNMGATTKPTSLEKNLAALAIKTSMYWRVPDTENPMKNVAEARKTGLSHYRAMCVRCHGGPGVQPQEFAMGLNPPAPMLEQAGEMFSDTELFWITKHGIRMTGMPAFGPTHEDADIWRIVEGLKAIGNLTAEEKDFLEGGQEEGHDHEHANENDH